MLYRLLLLAFACFTIAACNDPTDIGQTLLEEDEFFNSAYTDTLSIKAHTLRTDSTYTSPATYMPLGYLFGATNDPIFGRTTAGIYTQLGLAQTNNTLGDSLALDSIVLSLAYNDLKLYGDSTSRHNVMVYEVEEPIGIGAYFAEQHFAYNNTPIGYRNQVQLVRKKTVPVKKYVKYDKIVDNDTLFGYEEIDTVYLPPQLRVRLNDEVGWRILSRSGLQELKSTAALQQFFKGLYITTTGAGNSMAFVNFNINSALTIYYRSGSTKGLSLTLNLTGGIVNHLDHDYANTPISAAFAQPNPNGQEYAYLQGANGTHFEFEIPHFKALNGKIINKAELEMTILPEIDSLYAPATKVTTYAVDSTGRKLFLQEYPASNIRTPTYIAGFKYEGKNGENANIRRYTLNYRDFDQAMQDGYLVRFGVEIPDYIPSRAIICGPDHPQYPMKWKVYYTDEP